MVNRVVMAREDPSERTIIEDEGATLQGTDIHWKELGTRVQKQV